MSEYKSAISLEIGKVYEARDIEFCKEYNFPYRIKIIEEGRKRGKKIFIGHDKTEYLPDGRLTNLSTKGRFDLVIEVCEKWMKDKIKV
ncbi:hypothetical protein [Pedobacter sp.]|uniref:hypothetical protein n=1 Tax=Pedobacter sp. TaxID=1411316 RepID=UPI003C5F243E